MAQNYPVVEDAEQSAGYYTLPTQYNVAVALEKAQINEDKSSPDYLLQNLNDVYVDPDPRTYALSSYVYMIEPTGKYPSPESKITTAKRQTIADFLYYSICQGQKEIGPIGYSPLPVNLVEAGFGQLQKLKAADPKVDLTNRSVTTCDNPTFVKGHPSTNYLAKIAPQPPACDKQGAGPCAAGVTPSGTDTPPPSKGNGGKGGKGGGGATPSPTPDPGTTTGVPGTGNQSPGPQSSAPGVVLPTDSSGNVVSSGGGLDADAPVVAPPSLAGYRSSHSTKVLAPLAVILLLVALVLPPFVAHRMAANKRAGNP